MKINQDVYKFFVDNGCLLQERASGHEFVEKLKRFGGEPFLRALKSNKAHPLASTAPVYAAKNANRQLADMLCAYLTPERLAKETSRIQGFGYVKTNLPTLDLGCENGIILCCLAALNPQARFIGVDPCEPAIRVARERASELGLQNVEFVCDTAEHYLANVGDARFGLILALCLFAEAWRAFWKAPDQEQLLFRAFFRRLSSALGDGGRLVATDISLDDAARHGLANFVSRCDLSFASRESAVITHEDGDTSSFFVFKKGAGSSVQMATIKKLKRV